MVDPAELDDMVIAFSENGRRRLFVRAIDVGACYGNAESAGEDADMWRGRSAVEQASKWASSNEWLPVADAEEMPAWVDQEAQAAVDSASPLLASLAPGSSPVFLREFNNLQSALAADDAAQKGMHLVSFTRLG